MDAQINPQPPEDRNSLMPQADVEQPEARLIDTQFVSDLSVSSEPSEADLSSSHDWFNLARKLRQQNQELLETIVGLEQALADNRQQVQEQQLRAATLSPKGARSADTFISQQTEELSQAQRQIHSFLEELDASQQETQRQRLQLETLTEQLTAEREQVAQLERKCALLQEDAQEKTDQYAIAEQQIQELQARLQRQQRYTLQYKSALDQCLGKSTPKDDLEPVVDISSRVIAFNLPKSAPIAPWSSQVPSSEETKVLGAANPAPIATPIAETPSPTQPENLAKREVPQPPPVVQSAVEPPPQRVTPSVTVPLSFSIDRKKTPPKPKIDLPAFLRHS